MAIFDSDLFNPQRFSGWLPNTNWLQDALQTGLLARASQPIDQSDQTPSGPTYANGNQGSMGGVPFPIIGNAPTMEMSAQTQQPQQQAQQVPQQAPSQFNPGGNLMAGFQGFANASSPLQAIGNLVSGLVTGQRTDPMGVRLDLMRTQISALMQQPGMTMDKALAIVSNPKVQEGYYGLQKVAPGESLVSPSTLGGGGSSTGGYTNTTGIFNKQTLTTMADQYLAGDKSVLQNLSRSTLGAVNVAALRQRIVERMQERNIQPEEQAAKMAEYNGFVASQKTLGTRSANIDMAVTEANQLAPQVLQTSAQVDRTKFPLLNKLILAAKEGTGDPNVVKFGAALNSFINVYSRAINPFGSTTVNDKEHARELLSTYWSQGQIGAGIQQLQKEMELAQKSPDMVRSAIRKSFEAGTSDKPISIEPSIPKITNQADATTAYSQAKDAIAKGAPRDSVIQRLKQMGLPATGL